MTRWLRMLRLRLRTIVRGRQLDLDVDEELRDHVDRDIASRVARGESPADARRAALAALGTLDARAREVREARGFTWIRDAAQDARISLRMLRRRPAFSIVAIATLALGIGATTAMFTVVNGILLRPLAFPDPDRLVLLSMAPKQSAFGRWSGLVEEHYLAVSAGDQLLSGVASFSLQPMALVGGAEPAVVTVGQVTSEFFSVLGSAPTIGRTIVEDDAGSDAAGVLVISQRLWRTQFAGDPAVLGRQVSINGVSRRIVGVMPAGIDAPFAADAWVPTTIHVDPHNALSRQVVGRLRPGVDLQALRAEIEALCQPSLDGHGERPGEWAASVVRAKDAVVADVRTTLLVLLSAVAFVLLIACVNVASLFLARTSERDAEMSVRTALGASRRRLVRQLLTESAMVSLISAAVALVATRIALPAIASLAETAMLPRVNALRLDLAVFAFALAISLLTAVGFGVAPAWRARGKATAGRAASRGWTVSHDRMHQVLVVTEVALALVLLTGAGLMVKSLARLTSVDLGFATSQRASMTVDLPEVPYKSASGLQQFQRDVLAQLRRTPSIRSAGAVNWMPLGGNQIRGDFTLDRGRTRPPKYMVDKQVVSPAFFRAMGIRIRSGRDFSDADRAGAPLVAVVSANVAADLWPGEQALGQRLSMSDRPGSDDWITVVGIVDDVRQGGLTTDKGRAIYQPTEQVTRTGWLRHMTFVIEADHDVERAATAARAAFRAVDPTLPVPAVIAAGDLIALQTAASRVQTRLLSAFAATALVLTVVGIYGVIAYSVSRRRRELGIRMALGADHQRLAGRVVLQAVALAAAGVAIGSLGALAVTRVLRQFLFDVSPTDPATFLAVASILLVAAAMAAGVPARRASRVDPAIALRSE